MRLSYSILRGYQTCEFKAKVLSFDRVEVEDTMRDVTTRITGILAHAGMEGYLKACQIRPFIEAACSEFTFPEGFSAADQEALVAKATRLAQRTVDWFQPTKRFKTAVLNGHPLIDYKLLWEKRVGIFDAVVAKPDWVCTDKDGLSWILDWKFSSDMSDPEITRYDIQAALYQKVLAELGMPVRGTIMVRALTEDPTKPSVNKDGTMSRRPIRCSWHDYRQALLQHGLDPGAYSDMQDKLLPFHKEYRNYRSHAEVEAIWDRVVVPLATRISRGIEGGDDAAFIRSLDYAKCRWCGVREDCLAGLRGQATHPAYGSNSPVKEGE